MNGWTRIAGNEWREPAQPAPSGFFGEGVGSSRGSYRSASGRTRRRLHRWGRFTAITGTLAVLASAGQAHAATYHADNGASLQDAVASADAGSGPSTIDLSAGVFLPTSTLTISRDVTIIGPSSAPGAKLAGSAVLPFPSDLLLVEAHAKLTLSNVELTAGGGVGYAAIDDLGALDLESSTVAGNSGSGVWVQPGATATVRNSTISDGLGFGVVDDGTASFVNATVASNKDGGLENRGTLNLTNTIVAENTGSGDCESRASTSDHSLDSDGSCGVGALSRTNPELGRLMANGGPTSTQALEAGSPAIGAGEDAKCPADDQRHFARISGRCDLGAYEAGGVPGGAQASPGAGAGSGVPFGGANGALGVRAHGTLRGKRHSRIAFTIRVGPGHAKATFLYTDGARRVVLRKLTLRSLAINLSRGVATLRGSGVERPGGRRASVTVVLVSHAGHRSLRIGLSSGYHYSGRLLSGSITFVRTAG
jgi:hypothetical protein